MLEYPGLFAGQQRSQEQRMARKVFHSFFYDRDAWRVQQVKKMGVVEGQPLLTSQQWEDVEAGGDSAIEKWIDEQLAGKSCVIVLAGAATAGRKWVNYEIKKAWDDGKGLVAVHIHRLADQKQEQDTKGANPFNGFKVGSTNLASIAKAYDPPRTESTKVYAYIEDNLADWVEEAITIRNQRH
jgi:hypothetical protein